MLSPDRIAAEIPRMGDLLAAIRRQHQELVGLAQRYADILGQATRSLESAGTLGLAHTRQRLAEEIAVPLTRLSPGATGTHWAQHLVFDSAAVHHAARVLLLETVLDIGVFRELDDWPELTGGGIALLCIAAAADATPGRRPDADLSRLLNLFHHAPPGPALVDPGPGDAMLLGLLVPVPGLGRLLGLARGDGPGAGGAVAPPIVEVLAVAHWIAALHAPDAPAPIAPAPSGALWPQWLSLRAFRGPRRSWARARGLDAGRNRPDALPGWLAAPRSDPLPVGYGAMVVEWTLAALLQWPDREGLRDSHQPRLVKEVEPLLASARAALGRADGRATQGRWLEVAARALTSKEAPLRSPVAGRGGRQDRAVHS